MSLTVSPSSGIDTTPPSPLEKRNASIATLFLSSLFISLGSVVALVFVAVYLPNASGYKELLVILLFGGACVWFPVAVCIGRKTT